MPSSDNTVAFLGPESSPEITSLISHFNDEDYILIDTHSILQDTRISISQDILVEGSRINVGCYYVQSLLEHPFLAVRYGEQNEEELSEKYLHEYFNKFGILSSLLLLEQENGKTVINPISSYYSHHYKAYQTEILRSHGIPVPKTVSTNDPKRAREFVKNGKYIQKPVSGHDYVHTVEESNIPENIDKSISPQIFQEFVDGNDIRVYLLDGSVLGAYRIQSRDRPENLVDYRRYESGFLEVELAEKEKEVCKRASDILDMRFCAIDCRRDNSSSTFSIIDCNPNPAFVPIEDDLGIQTITKSLVEYIKDES